MYVRRSVKCVLDEVRIMNEQFVANQTGGNKVNGSLYFTHPLGVKFTQIDVILNNASVSQHERYFSIVRHMQVKRLE